MSVFLNEVVSNKISLDEALQRLLVISNKIENSELSQWCKNELNGYDKYDDLPDYRKFKSREIIYSGINGRSKITNAPLGLGYLSEETLKKVESVPIFENIVEINSKIISKDPLYRDLTMLAGEVLERTGGVYAGVQCYSIKQVMPLCFYSEVYSSVKTRIINLLCSFESAKINVDKFDIRKSHKKLLLKSNNELYKNVVVLGETYKYEFGTKILWNFIIPIITAVLSGIIVYFITINL